MMETGSNSRVKGSDSKSGSSTQCSSRSISDLPKDILVKILLRLTVKRILVCKSVCKSWYGLISDPEFAKLHFDQAEVCPLLESSNSMYLVEPEKHDVDLKLGMCDRTVGFRPDLIFRAPPFPCFIVNSCNGLLLLYFLSPELLTVCNPVTGELIPLPDCRKVDSQDNHIKYGFGFSSTSQEYKVIRMVRSGSSTSQDMIVYVHVLGTELWKDMGLLALPVYDSYPTYVNGFLYWSVDLISKPIVSFDVEKECFRSFFVKGVDHLEVYIKPSIGELGQELCVYGFLMPISFHVWVMKDHCDEKVWSLVFSIHMPSHGRQLYGLRPVKYLNDGSLLMFDCYLKTLICIDSRKSAVRRLKVCGTKSASVRVIAYIPSFVSLKQALSRQNANVKALIRTKWFAEPERETRDVYVVEKELCNLYSFPDSYPAHFILEGFDSDSDEAELYQEEIDSEDEDQEIGSEDEDQEVGSEDEDHEFSSNNMDEDQEVDPEEVDSEDRNDDQEFDFEDRDGELELDSEDDGDGEFDPEDEDPELDFEDDGDGDWEFDIEDGSHEVDCDFGDEDFDYDDGDQDFDSDDEY